MQNCNVCYFPNIYLESDGCCFSLGQLSIHVWGAPVLKERNCYMRESMHKREDYVAFYKIVGGPV